MLEIVRIPAEPLPPRPPSAVASPSSHPMRVRGIDGGIVYARASSR